MDVAVVYESVFGSTRVVAEAIAEGLHEADPMAHVVLVPVADATSDKVGETDLLVVGGPTHMLRMSTERTRRMGVEYEEKAGREAAEKGRSRPSSLEPRAAGPGVREWLDSMPDASPGKQAAAFDTRLRNPLAVGAARGIARRLRRHRYVVAIKPRGFVVDELRGPLRAGECEAAKAWGASLVGQLVH